MVLEPIYDADKRFITADLELCRLGAKAQCGLLQPRGTWHGVQPYSFFADDYATHARPSAFGAERQFALNRLGMRLNARVVKADVKSLPHPRDADHRFAFDDVTVQITLKDVKARKH